MNSRQGLLGSALMLTMAATAWTAWNDQEIAKPSGEIEVKIPSKITLSEKQAKLKVSEFPEDVHESRDIQQRPNLFREPLSMEVGNLFDVDAPKGQVLVAEAATNTITPFPYNYVGKMVDADGVSVFLTAGDINIVARVHDVIDKQWKVEQIRLPSMTIQNLLTKRRSIIMVEEKSE